MRFLLLSLLALTGCARPRPALTYIVPIQCLTQPIRFVGCDQSNPPQCKQTITHYTTGCLQLEAK